MIHYSFIGFMLASAIIMLACIAAYRLFLENKVLPKTNRLILLSIYGISFIFPLIIACLPNSSQSTGIEIGQLQFAGIKGNVMENETMSQTIIPNIFQWIDRIYLTGLFIIFVFTVLTVGYLLVILGSSRKIEIAGIEVHVHGNRKLSSFTWCNKIFLYKDALTSTGADLRMLVSHEKAHLERAHWIDLALAQIILIFQWFNPAAWFMRKELQRIHEYEADSDVLDTGVNEKDYQMLLIQNISGSRYSGLTDGLNNCSLKTRIIMMKKTKFKKDRVARGLAVFGFAVLGGLIIHIPAVADVVSTRIETPSFQEAPEPSDAEIASGYRGDTSDKSYEEFREGDVYRAAEIMPMYAGSPEPFKLLEDLMRTMKYPENAEKNKIQGRVVVRFTVFKDGKVGDFKVVRSVDPELDNEAITAIKNLPNTWTPGTINGKAVNCYFNLPVTFRLSGDDDAK